MPLPLIAYHGMFALHDTVSAASAAASLPAVVSILVSKNAGRYRIQADSYPAMVLVLDELEKRLHAKVASTAGAAGG